MKKAMVSLSVLLILTLLVGCTPVELEFYSLIKEASTLEATRTEGEIEVELSGTAIDMAKLMSPELAIFTNQLDGLVLRYSGEQSIEDNSMYMDFEFKNNANTSFRPLTTIIMEDGIMYVNMKTITDLLVEETMHYDEAMALEIQEEFEGVDYIKMDASPMMEEIYGVESPKEFMEGYFSVIDIFTEVFKGLDTKTVTKEGNKYTYEIGTDNFLNVAETIFVHILENSQEVIEALDNIVADADNEIFREYLTMLNLTKEDIREGLLEANDEIQENQEEILEKFYDFRNKVEEDGFLEMFQGSKITYALEKLSDNSYEVETDFVLKADIEGQTLNFVVREAATVTEIDKDEIEIKQPTGKIMEIEQPTVAESMYMNHFIIGDMEYVENTHNVIVNVDTGEYISMSYDDTLFDKVNVVVEEGRSYLPLRRIGEDLGEVVVWDKETSTPYILRGETRIDMDGLLIDGTAYVMVRDFEKLGYMVDWSDETREVFISRTE